MGRAQVVQAEASKEIPRAFMNPILLKPNSDNNSQVIIEGKPQVIQGLRIILLTQNNGKR